MAPPESPDRHQARAIIVAAVIGVAGSVAAAYLGREAGQRGAQDDMRRLEARFEEAQREGQRKDEQLDQALREIAQLRETLSQRVATPGQARTPQTTPAASTTEQQPVTTDQPVPPTETQPLASAKEQGFLFDLMGCNDEGSSIRCDVVVTNQRSDRWIWISSGRDHATYLVDAAGNQCSAGDSSFTWGTLPESVPTRMTFEFQRCARSVTHLAFFQIGFKLGSPAFPTAFKVPFRDIPVSAE